MELKEARVTSTPPALIRKPSTDSRATLQPELGLPSPEERVRLQSDSWLLNHTDCEEETLGAPVPGTRIS